MAKNLILLVKYPKNKLKMFFQYTDCGISEFLLFRIDFFSVFCFVTILFWALKLFVIIYLLSKGAHMVPHLYIRSTYTYTYINRETPKLNLIFFPSSSYIVPHFVYCVDRTEMTVLYTRKQVIIISIFFFVNLLFN